MQKKEEQIFPYKVDVPSFPERKWIRAIRIFTYITCINLAFTCVLTSLLLFFSSKKETIPSFLYFSNSSLKFETLNIKEGSAENKIALSQKDLLKEQFIKSYIESRYNISNFMADNNYKWCNCLSDIEKKVIQTSYTKRENIKCSLCMMSDPKVYSEFETKERSVLLSEQKLYGASSIEIKNIKKTMSTSTDFTDTLYDIYEIDIKVSYEKRDAKFQKVFMGIADAEQINSKKMKEAEKKWIQADPYLFKVVSYGISDYIRESYE